MKFIFLKVLKGNAAGELLLDQQFFDHNMKEVDNLYDIDLLKSFEFDERMFAQNDPMLVCNHSPNINLATSVTPKSPIKGRAIMVSVEPY